MVNRNKLKLWRCHRRGASATELAIIAPLFVTIALGCVDFGRFAYNYIALSNAVRAGAAWAMINRPSSYTSPPSAWQSSIVSAVTNEISSQPGFQSGSLNVTSPPSTPTALTQDSGGSYQVTVSATYQFTTVVNWNISVFGTTLGIPHSLTLSSSVTMRFIRTT